MNTELSKMTTTNGLEEVIIKLFKMTPQFKNLMTEMKTIIENKVNVSNNIYSMQYVYESEFTH